MAKPEKEANMDVKMSSSIQPELSELSAAVVKDDFCVYVHFPRDVICACAKAIYLLFF